MFNRSGNFWRHCAAVSLVVLCFVPGISAAEVTQADHRQFSALIEQGAKVIDIRTAPEWQQTGVVHNSHLMTFFDQRGQFDLDAWVTRLSGVVDRDDTVVIVCSHGVRSAAVSRVLDQRLGYTRVVNVSRGLDNWMKHGGRTRQWQP